MAEIPESLLRRSAEAKAKALGLPVEQVLAEMKGEAPPAPIPAPVVEEPVSPTDETPDARRQTPNAAEAPPAEEPEAETPEPEKQEGTETPEESPEPEISKSEEPAPVSEEPNPEPETSTLDPQAAGEPQAASEPQTSNLEPQTAVATAVIDPEPPTPAPPGPEAPSGNGSGNGKRAALVQPRPVAPAAGVPEGVRTQRLLTVVKARAIQQVKSEPTDKVNTWPHLMIGEFAALLAVTGVLIILSVILQAPLLDPANFNATPNPSKAPWYFLGLQELLSYFDPQIAGVTVPTIVGLIGFMAVPYVDRNPSTKPSDRKFAVMLYTIFMAGAATLTIFGVLFRGRGFNFSYPWKDGVFFDDLKDWVFFE